MEHSSTSLKSVEAKDIQNNQGISSSLSLWHVTLANISICLQHPLSTRYVITAA